MGEKTNLGDKKIIKKEKNQREQKRFWGKK